MWRCYVCVGNRTISKNECVLVDHGGGALPKSGFSSLGVVTMGHVKGQRPLKSCSKFVSGLIQAALYLTRGAVRKGEKGCHWRQGSICHLHSVGTGRVHKKWRFGTAVNADGTRMHQSPQASASLSPLQSFTKNKSKAKT